MYGYGGWHLNMYENGAGHLNTYGNRGWYHSRLEIRTEIEDDTLVCGSILEIEIGTVFRCSMYGN